jgi:UDP-N-acetylglucosamine acyltransferase
VTVPVILPTAIVDDGARIGEGATIGAFSTVGAEVEIGPNVEVGSHVVLTGRTTIGEGVRVFPFAAIGGPPQDTSYKGEPSTVRIGAHTIVREHVTIHRGTARGKMHTEVGHHAFLMVGCHIAHDCIVGNHVTMVNGATIGGHVEIGDYAQLGGLCAVQQRLRIGAYAFVGGLTGVNAEIIPFAIAVGDRAELAGLNIVGLKRRGFTRPDIHALRRAYREIFIGAGTLEERVEDAAVRFADVPPVMTIIDFVRKGGKRALCLPRNLEG